MKQQALLLFNKVWSAYTKYLQNQVLSKGRTVLCPVFGTFLPAASYIQVQSTRLEEDTGSQASGPLTPENLGKLESTSVCFAPNV